MGVRILEGTKIDGGGGKGAVIYCSTSGVALPMMFENGEEARRFLDWFGVDPREDHDLAWQKWEEWLQMGKPSKQDFDDLLKDP